MASYSPNDSELGKKSQYPHHYSPDILYPISRQKNRDALGIVSHLPLPFYGFDRWNHYEVSWLNEKGKPVVAVAEINYGCDSQNIIESKSLKLYFNSLNQSSFKTARDIEKVVSKDLAEKLAVRDCSVRIIPLSSLQHETLFARLEGLSIDELDIECSIYQTHPDFLFTENEYTEEILCSDLLKSNCLVTHQPDWGSVKISYKGKKINHEGLLRYIVSFRECNEFHEQCIEKIFIHIMKRCQPDQLSILGRSTRRGGIDINSYRSTHPVTPHDLLNQRLYRQ